MHSIRQATNLSYLTATSDGCVLTGVGSPGHLVGRAELHEGRGRGSYGQALGVCEGGGVRQHDLVPSPFAIEGGKIEAKSVLNTGLGSS